MLTKAGNHSNLLDLNMTAQEMRAKLAAKKKDKMDPKNQNIDLKKKYDIIQTLWLMSNQIATLPDRH